MSDRNRVGDDVGDSIRNGGNPEKEISREESLLDLQNYIRDDILEAVRCNC